MGGYGAHIVARQGNQGGLEVEAFHRYKKLIPELVCVDYLIYIYHQIFGRVFVFVKTKMTLFSILTYILSVVYLHIS